MVVGQPLEELPCLGQLCVVQARSALGQFVGDFSRLLLHRPPIFDRSPHIGQSRADAALDPRQRIGRSLTVEPNMNQGFGGRICGIVVTGEVEEMATLIAAQTKHRVQDQVYAKVKAR